MRCRRSLPINSSKDWCNAPPKDLVRRFGYPCRRWRHERVWGERTAMSCCRYRGMPTTHAPEFAILGQAPPTHVSLPVRRLWHPEPPQGLPEASHELNVISLPELFQEPSHGLVVGSDVLRAQDRRWAEQLQKLSQLGFDGFLLRFL